MMSLLLIGLITGFAKLWFDVAALRTRIMALEGATPRARGPESEQPMRSDVPTLRAMRPSATSPLAEPAARPRARATKMPSADVAPAVETGVQFDTPGLSLTGKSYRSGFEDLFGRKLPIWAGGVTLAVAGFLIVKYSIDAGLLSPTIRIVLGLLFGTGLIASAEAARRADDRVRDPRVRQALSGAGIATLYASILAAANLYHLVGPMSAFVGMALTTVLAGVLSLRFGAPSAILGLVGGLAAPALVGSGTPDVPLLSIYLALTVGGLCALSWTQRWVWLGVAALVGGFGWGALLMLSGALDLAATLSLGAYALLLGIGLPLLAFRSSTGTMVRLAGSLAACAQLAGLVALGGFAPLEWSLFGLVSIAVVWLSRREARLAELAAAGLGVALFLTIAWPEPAPAMLVAVLLGIAAIFGLPAARRLWRRDARLSDAVTLAAIAFASVLLPATKLDLTDAAISALALLGAIVTAGVAGLGWKAPDRTGDPRFAILVTTTATLLAAAATLIAPAWLDAPLVAIAAISLLLLAERADDLRIDGVAALFATTAIVAAFVVPGHELVRASGLAGLGLDAHAAGKWLVPALMAAVFAWRGRLPNVERVAQPLAVLLGYIAMAQLVPISWLPLVPVAMLAALAFARRLMPALLAAAAVTVGWAALPLLLWLTIGRDALLGMPMLVGALPALDDTALRLGLPALAALSIAWRRTDVRLRTPALAIGSILIGVALHIVFKHLFAIADDAAFVRLGLAERTVWEIALAALAVLLWRRVPVAGQALAALSVAHFGWFTLLLHNPLWTLQAVGPWPVANLLVPAFGTAFALTSLARGLSLSPFAKRLRETVQMALISAFSAATLRHAFHGTYISVGAVSQGEDIARSVLLIALAIGFLRHGIVAGLRDWRIASLVLMLAAVGKVFLIDAAGLDGLLRIASFAALGFSLIGIGWLYSRYLPEDPDLTSRSEMPATAVGGN